MKYFLLLPLVALISLGACKNSRKAKNAEETTITESHMQSEKNSTEDLPEAKDMSMESVAPAEEPVEPETPQADPNKHKPTLKDDAYFKMIKTPCFGRCPVYEFEVKQNGTAFLEGKKFFDYEGFFQAQITESQLKQIQDWAEAAGYFELDHVYDAPVTDLPSTTTALRTRDGVHWVYNRMNAPGALNQFQSEIETLIKDLQWKPISGE